MKRFKEKDRATLSHNMSGCLNSNLISLNSTIPGHLHVFLIVHDDFLPFRRGCSRYDPSLAPGIQASQTRCAKWYGMKASSDPSEGCLRSSWDQDLLMHYTSVLTRS